MVSFKQLEFMALLEPNWQEQDLRDSEYIRNLHPVFDTVMDTYKNVKAPKVTGHITLWDVLQKIKYNLGQGIMPQMFLTPKYVDNVLNPVYDNLKEKQLAICYNASFNRYKNLSNTKKIHNLMFLDIDNFSTSEEALAYKTEIFRKYDWILACSLSLSKIGLHVIVMVDKITGSRDYNRKYDYISKEYFCGGLDPNSKSLSQFTIIPYDHDIFISDNPVVLPIDSILQKSMGSTYIKSSSQHDKEKSTSSVIGGKGICTTHTFSIPPNLNELLNTSARENDLIFKPFANENLIEDPDKPLFNADGFPVVEINLFIYKNNGVTEGHRTSFLGAILSQMIYLNVILPDKPNPDVRKNLLGFIRSVNRKYCNPSLPNDELLKSYNSHWKRYHEGKLDITKYLKLKRSLWSQYCTLSGNQKRSETMTQIHSHKRKGKLEILLEIIQRMADNGEKITQQIVTEEIKKRGIKGLGITTIKILWKHFKPSVQAYRKGRSNEIKLDESESKSTVNMKKTNHNNNIEVDYDDDVLDLGTDILENHKNILAKEDNGNKKTDSVNLTEEQKSLIFNRVYSRFLPIFSDDEVRERLHSRFLAKLEDFDSEGKMILCLKPESITDGDVFAKQFSLESQLQSICYELSEGT